MLGQSIAMEKFMPQEQEVLAIKQLEHILGIEGFQAKLVGVNVEEIVIPKLLQLFLRVWVLVFFAYATTNLKKISHIDKLQVLWNESTLPYALGRGRGSSGIRT
jgi:hypothetical protein